MKEAVISRARDWTQGRLPGVHEALVDQGQEWAVRITESWHAIVFSAFYVFGTILFQFAPMNVLSEVANSGQPFWVVCQVNAAKCAIGFSLRFVDVVRSSARRNAPAVRSVPLRDFFSNANEKKREELRKI